jgi:hypothetical protein
MVGRHRSLLTRGRARIVQRHVGDGDRRLQERSDADAGRVPELREERRRDLLHRTPKNQEPGQEPQQNPGGRPAGPTSGHQDIADWVAASFTSTSVGNATVYDLQKPK